MADIIHLQPRAELVVCDHALQSGPSSLQTDPHAAGRPRRTHDEMIRGPIEAARAPRSKSGEQRMESRPSRAGQRSGVEEGLDD
jgi:hypothetical protein